MGNTCQFSKIDKKQQQIRLIGVDSQQFPNKQTKLENYSYNIQQNTDKFDDEFYHKSFELDIHNQKVSECEQNRKDENLSLLNSHDFLEDNQIRTQFSIYNQMASEAFVNFLQNKPQKRNQRCDRYRENVQQKRNVNSIQCLSQIDRAIQFKVTDFDSITQNSNKICKSIRGSKSTLHSNYSSQRPKIRHISSKQICNIKIIYF